MAARKTFEAVLDPWLERDLSAAARAGDLPRALCVDEALRRLTEAVASGRHPILAGESGIGKTALVYELVRRACAGEGPAVLAERRVVQLSFYKRLSALRKRDDMNPAMAELVEALIAQSDVVPFFRDVHLVAELNLVPQLELLGMRAQMPVLAEGDGGAVAALFEDFSSLEQYFLPQPLEEPGLEAMRQLLAAWNAEQAARGRAFEEEALEEGLELTHRFLSRQRHPRKSLELLAQVRSLTPPERAVTSRDVIDRFERAYRVPRFLIDPAVPFDVAALERELAGKVLGQAPAVRAVVRMIGVVKAGLSDPRRPFGAFLFTGPTGVGKTHLAQLLAEHLFGSRERIVRLNMADYQAPGDPWLIFGNPSAYNLSDKRGLLAGRLAGHPFAVLLLDELEKAHALVHDRLLQLLDEGAYINGAGETVSCRSLIIIATSNAGAEVYRSRGIGFETPAAVADLERELERRLVASFRIEFLNRFDQVVHFRPLAREDIRTIALREIEALCQRSGLRRRGAELEVDELVLDWLTAHGHDPLFGARFLRRTVERHVTTALAELLVRDNPGPGSRIALGVRGGRPAASLLTRPKRESVPVVVPIGKSEKSQSLDRAALLAEVDALLARAAGRLTILGAEREAASELVHELSRPELWSDAERAQALLARHRELDVSVHMGARYAEPVEWLAELRPLAAAEPRRTDELARAFERAADALRRWEERLAESGPSAVWLVLRDTDPRYTASEWLAELAAMELAWARHLNLAAEVAAFGLGDERLARVVLDVEGPGAAGYLAMEHGLHRLHKPDGNLRVRIDCIPKGPRDTRHKSRSVRRREGPLGFVATHALAWRAPERGVALEWLGHTPEVLVQLVSDLERAESAERAERERDEVELVRSYANQGSGARDPRTGAVVARYRDVMKGRLDVLLEAFRALRAGRAAESAEP